MSSCSHKVIRSGYQIEKTDYVSCEIPIKKFYSVTDTNTKVVGKIELKDTGFSAGCNEQKAIEILIGEACARKADLIVITKESRPDFSSSCYRCEAVFYQFTSEEKPLLKSDIKNDEVEERVLSDKKRNQTIFWTSFAVGFVIGFILVQ